MMAARAASSLLASGWARISRRRLRRPPPIQMPTEEQPTSSSSPPQQQHNQGRLSRGMDLLRASIRRSLRRRRQRSRDRPLNAGSGSPVDTPPPPSSASSAKSQLWQPDEAAVRSGTCSFHYLGGVEVFESRGMQVCEGALKVLRSQRRRPVKAVLYVSGDGLRVVDSENNRGLIVDQTIEKVSFCAPDRNHDKGFAYICRDGTSRRWMCHGFHATKETGERLSHAVGCAFAVCLERKKKRDSESATVSSEAIASTPVVENGFARANNQYSSFRRQLSIGERIQDPQTAIVAVPAPPTVAPFAAGVATIAKPRPAPNPALFARQGSLRAPDPVAGSAAFRRQFSLRSEVVSKPIQPMSSLLSYNEPIYEGDESSASCSDSFRSKSTQEMPVFVGFNNSALTCTPIHGPHSPMRHAEASEESRATRSKADEWLEQTLKSSLFISSSPVPDNAGSSGPPPAQPPPPLPPVAVLASPTRAVYDILAEPGVPQSEVAFSRVDIFGQPEFNPLALPDSRPSNGFDPFDVQWSSMSSPGNGGLRSTNPFEKESAQVSI